MPSATPDRLSPAGLQFLTERHLATFTSLLPSGEPHVTPVGFTWDGDQKLARVITGRHSRKARNVLAGTRVVLCQLDGRRWLALDGAAQVADDAESVAEAERRYAARYRVPRPNPDRVAIVITVSRLLGSAEFFA